MQGQAAPRYGLVIAVTALAFLALSSDFSLMSVALPSIEREFALSADAVSFLVALNSLTFAGFLILGGRLADRYGQCRCCVAGLACFAIGASLTACAPGVLAFGAGRALQGLGAAVLSPASFSLLNTALPDGPWRRRGYGVFAAVQSAALIVGFLIGGAVTTSLGWRAAFLINVPVAAFAATVALRVVPRAPLDPQRGALDVPGAMLVTGSVALLVWTISTVGAGGWLSLQVVGGLAASAACFGGFLLLESRLAKPLLPLSIFAARNLIGNNLATICCMAGGAAVFFLPNLYMQQVLGLSAAQSGLGMLPHSLGGLLAGRLLVIALRRFSLRVNILAGLGAVTAGLLFFYALPLLLPHGGYFGHILAPLMVCACATLFTGLVLMAGGTHAVPLNQQGVASALALTAQQIGLALGIAVVLTVTGKAQAAGASVLVALRSGYLAAALLAVAGVLCILFGTQVYETARGSEH